MYNREFPPEDEKKMESMTLDERAEYVIKLKKEGKYTVVDE